MWRLELLFISTKTKPSYWTMKASAHYGMGHNLLCAPLKLLEHLPYGVLLGREGWTHKPAGCLKLLDVVCMLLHSSKLVGLLLLACWMLLQLLTQFNYRQMLLISDTIIFKSYPSQAMKQIC